MDERLEKEALRRLQSARQQKTRFDRMLREGYYFTAPHRMRSVSSATVQMNTQPDDDADQLFTSFGFEVAGDFPTVMINTFCPQAEPWVMRKAGWGVPADIKQKFDEAAKEGTATIFEAISASNFYAECGKGFNPDLALGTVAMWIEPGQAGQPIRCQIVPIRELEINLSPWGEVDDRFVVRWTTGNYVRAILPGVDLPKEIAEKIDAEPDSKHCVVWGFWRVYDDPLQEEVWQHVVLVGKTLVSSSKPRGVGCCPLVVARFNPSPEYAWGLGPLIQALPDLRSHDDISHAKLKNLGLLMDPPISYPDDSFTHIEQGFESGHAYPIRPGTGIDIKAIYQPPPQDVAIYDRQQLEQRIKRLFFLDWPEQRGDTPPTATQWLDQMTMAQQRVGTPGLPFWREHCGGTFLRFQYILEKAGAIEPVKVDGKTVAMQPYNPAQRAADQQDVAQAIRFAQIAAAMFPEEWKVAYAGIQTMDNLAKLMGVTKIFVSRDPKDVQAALAHITQLAQGTPPGAPAGAGAGPGAPPPQPGMPEPAPAPPAISIKSAA